MLISCPKMVVFSNNTRPFTRPTHACTNARINAHVHVHMRLPLTLRRCRWFASNSIIGRQDAFTIRCASAFSPTAKPAHPRGGCEPVGGWWMCHVIPTSHCYPVFIIYMIGQLPGRTQIPLCGRYTVRSYTVCGDDYCILISDPDRKGWLNKKTLIDHLPSVR